VKSGKKKQPVFYEVSSFEHRGKDLDTLLDELCDKARKYQVDVQRTASKYPTEPGHLKKL